VCRNSGPAYASAGGGLVCAMTALTAFMFRGTLPGAQLQHTCAAHPTEVQLLQRAPVLRAAGCFLCVSAVSTFLGISETHKTAMARNVLTPEIQPFEPLQF
jgi:hypothetical protein